MFGCGPGDDDNRPLKLYTISFSHYVDLARWALDLTGTQYTEEAYLPAFHIAFGPFKKLRGTDQTSAPLLAQGKTVRGADSFGVLEYCFPDNKLPDDIKLLLDEVVGPTTRTLMYAYELDPGDGGFITPEQAKIGDALYLKICQKSTKVSGFQKFLVGLSGPRKKIRSVMHSLMVKNPQFVAESRTKLEEAAAKLEPMLDDPIFNGSKEGEEIAPGAIAVASLFQIMVCAPEFQRVVFGGEVVSLDELPEGYRKDVEYWRQRKVGQFTMAMYKRRSEVQRRGATAAPVAQLEVREPAEVPAGA